MPAVDQPLAEAALRRRERVEVDARGVLVEPGRGLMFGFLDCDPDHVIDTLADLGGGACFNDARVEIERSASGADAAAVAARATRTALMTASVPDEVNRRRSIDGIAARIASPSSISSGCVAPRAKPFRAALATASTTAG